MRDLYIYIHIPFCDHKCIYCDFYSIINKENESLFFEALKKEIDHYASQFSDGSSIKSIYFGGGTPSFVDSKYIADIIDFISKKFTLSDYVEITIETNPGTVDLTKLKHYRSAGLNRVSIGVQSFDGGELKFLTRIHDKKTAVSTIRNAYESGFENINIDLIFNLPKQTKEILRENLNTAISLPVKHISAYSLILERGTILNKLVLEGKVKISDADYDAELYEFTIDYLTNAGYVQYEVSNFAKPGYECIHNLAYWQHKNYIGFGTSAHSFIDNKRWWNLRSLKMYINSINEKGNAVISSEQLTNDEMRDEYIMLNLRAGGLNLDEYATRFDDNWLNKNSTYLNLLEINELITRSNNFIKFTKRGYSLCDEILSKFQ